MHFEAAEICNNLGREKTSTSGAKLTQDLSFISQLLMYLGAHNEGFLFSLLSADKCHVILLFLSKLLLQYLSIKLFYSKQLSKILLF